MESKVKVLRSEEKIVLTKSKEFSYARKHPVTFSIFIHFSTFFLQKYKQMYGTLNAQLDSF